MLLIRSALVTGKLEVLFSYWMWWYESSTLDKTIMFTASSLHLVVHRFIKFQLNGMYLAKFHIRVVLEFPYSIQIFGLPKSQ